ncbi:glycosyltransferase family 1 protein [Xylariaceae sp. FL1019]|nr:glycosyltransferase family 1 protein [Xylariaceae sp. FL1019]
MAFMVKHPGLMPGIDALKEGEITKRRLGIEQIITGCWRSCIETGDGLGPAPRFDRQYRGDSAALPPAVVTDPSHKPFVADAIIANPPSFAHIHVAEKLGIPLHLMFTMPWSPTRAFPQPLANIQSSNTDPVTTNYFSYALVEMMTWQGLGDVINRFRTKVLDLEPLSLIWAPGVLTRLRIPYTYCWSPALIPKPNDWGNHIDIAGFYFLNLASSYTPEPDLAAFLEAGPPPVYIGFGSIVVDDPNALTRMIFDAVAETGIRALVSKGWGGLGADSMGVPDGVFMLGNVPHDWLFKHVSAVCHHGGAGTTAAGIQAGKPTIVVPFFGDQPFWGAMVARAGAGPDPIPYKKLTAEGLAEAIRVALKPETQDRAKELGEKIREEKGADMGGQSFHKFIDFDGLRCAIAPSRVAVWRVRRSKTHLSALAAATLVDGGFLQYSDLKLFRAKEYNLGDHPTDPITAVTSALVGDVTTILMSAADFPRDLFKAARGSPKLKTQDSSRNNSMSTNLQEATESTQTLASTASRTLNKGETYDSNEDLTPITSVASGQRDTPSSHTQSDQTPQGPSASVNQHLERALGAGKSINNIVSTGVKSPLNFCMGLAKGFRNAPSLYNDDTIRPVEKVTDFNSGLKVAAKEFGLGMFDGITGLVTQPLKGAEKEGGAGLLKGFGKGIGGVALKVPAAFWSIPAYTMAGVHAEIRTRFAQNAAKYIIASRIAQGDEDFKQSTAGEREDIEVRWLSQKEDLKGFHTFKQKEKGKSREGSPPAPEYSSVSDTPKTGWRHTRNLSFDERKKLQDQKKAWKRSREDGSRVEEKVPSRFGASGTNEMGDEYESAIQSAVHETSRGDPAEDARIEQAIRSSVGVLERHSSQMRSGSATSMNTGFSQWIPDTKQGAADEKREAKSATDDLDITDEEYQTLIAEAIKLSMEEQPQHRIQTIDRENPDESSDEDYQAALQRSKTEDVSRHEDDEEYKRALAASQVEHEAKNQGPGEDDEALRTAIEASQKEDRRQPDDDDELKRALEQSEKDHQAELARMSSIKSEEEIVMEYVKKQSLAEEEYRKKTGQEKIGKEEEEELRRAMEESMKSGGRSGGGESSRR